MSGFPDDLPGQVAWLVHEIAEIKRRDRNRKRTGRVAEVDPGSGLARVEFEERESGPYVGPWMPWKEIAAGGIKSHIPPSVGEQVDVVSESGDLTDGVIDMSTPSNENPRPHNGPEAVLTHGAVRIEVSGETVAISAPGTVLVNSPDVRLGGPGGKRVARLGDLVEVGTGSSAGQWPIVTAASKVRAE